MSGGVNPPRPWPSWARFLTGLAIVAVAGALIWSQLPRGAFPTDLSRIGDGRPALVLAYDHFYVGGGQIMSQLNEIRADYGDRVEILVADMSTQDGRVFAERHGVYDGTVLVFDAHGNHTDTINQPQNAAEIRQALDAAFSP